MLQKGSELVLGKFGAPKKFTIQTKAPGFSPGALGKQNILDGMKQTLEELKTDSVSAARAAGFGKGY
jgi:aflatoxin B1 aldehyde reductase